VLLVDGDTGTADPGTARTLRSLGVTDVYVAGGTAAVPTSITKPLTKVAAVHRVAGPNRAATASALAATLRPTATSAVLATSSAMPDALTGAVLAARSDVPLLMTSASCVPSATLAALASMGASSVTLLGGGLAAPLDTLRACSTTTYRPPS
jgi:putative cell wall-binding protein